MQRQKWFLLELCSSEDKINFNTSYSPEFDRWRWVGYWLPIDEAISFKQKVYQRALQEFEPIIFGTN